VQYRLTILRTGGSVWLKQWSEINDQYGRNPDVGRYIGIYFAFGVGGSALVVMQTLILWIFCSIEVSCCNVFVYVLPCMTPQKRGNDGLLGLTRVGTGEPEAPRTNGVRHLQVSDGLLRDDAQRTHSQPFLEVSASSSPANSGVILVGRLHAVVHGPCGAEHLSFPGCCVVPQG